MSEEFGKGSGGRDASFPAGTDEKKAMEKLRSAARETR
jgi:hypothetical protein